MVHQSVVEHKHCLCTRPPPPTERAGLTADEAVVYTCEGVPPLSASLMCAVHTQAIQKLTVSRGGGGEGGCSLQPGHGYLHPKQEVPALTRGWRGFLLMRSLLG